MDTLCRCVGASLLLSYEIRRDTEVYLVLMEGDCGPKTVRFEG